MLMRLIHQSLPTIEVGNALFMVLSHICIIEQYRRFIK